MAQRTENKEGSKFVVDTHCHILPGLDDGSGSFETTLEMLKIAEAEGITHMVATPHFKYNHRNASAKTVEETFEKVKNQIAENDINIELYLGNEVMFFNDLQNCFEEQKFRTLNGTEFLLTEFYPDDEFMNIRRGLETVSEAGLIPVLAHAERYKALTGHFANAEVLSDMGVLISVNASSVIGESGFKIKRFVKKLLKNKLVSFVATDSHDNETRAPYFKECRDYLYSKYDEEYVDRILFKNAFELFETKTEL